MPDARRWRRCSARNERTCSISRFSSAMRCRIRRRSLQLGFTGSPGIDTGSEARELNTASRESRQTIAILSQLDLQSALTGPGMLGKDVENDGRSVQHLNVQRALEVTLLRGRQLVVGNDCVEVQGPLLLT